jgi:hypothetical protein
MKSKKGMMSYPQIMKGEKHHAAVSRLFDNSIDLIDGGGAM